MAENMKSLKVPLWIPIYVVVSAIAFFAIGYLGMFNLEALSGQVPSPDAQHHANFMAGRQFVLALALVALLYIKEYRSLGFLLFIMGFIQVFDAGLNISDGELAGETFGMITLAILNFLSGKKLHSLTNH
jgi:hypothetical protein